MSFPRAGIVAVNLHLSDSLISCDVAYKYIAASVAVVLKNDFSMVLG